MHRSLILIVNILTRNKVAGLLEHLNRLYKTYLSNSGLQTTEGLVQSVFIKSWGVMVHTKLSQWILNCPGINAKVFIDTIHRALAQTSLQNFKIYLAKANTFFNLTPGMNAGSILSDNYNMHLF